MQLQNVRRRHKFFGFVLMGYLGLYSHALFCPKAKAAPIQFYVGGSFQIDGIKRILHWDENRYWPNSFYSCYEKALHGVYEQQQEEQIRNDSSRWYEAGLPQNYFKMLLQNVPSNIYEKTVSSSCVGLTLGAYVFRKESFLIAIEGTMGHSTLDIKEAEIISLFKGDVPKSIEHSFSDGSDSVSLEDGGVCSPLKAQSIQTMYFGGNSYLNERISIKMPMAASFLFRIGCAAKKRFFVFALIGPTFDRVEVKTNESVKSSDIILYYSLNRGSYEETSDWGRTGKLDENPKLETKCLNFNEKKILMGVMGGIGAECFISRKLSVRCQVAFHYVPDMKLPSVMGENRIRWNSKGCSVSGGLFWRL